MCLCLVGVGGGERKKEKNSLSLSLPPPPPPPAAVTLPTTHLPVQTFSLECKNKLRKIRGGDLVIAPPSWFLGLNYNKHLDQNGGKNLHNVTLAWPCFEWLGEALKECDSTRTFSCVCWAQLLDVRQPPHPPDLVFRRPGLLFSAILCLI